MAVASCVLFRAALLIPILWFSDSMHGIKDSICCRDAQMKKEANQKRIVEKQKEAKLAVSVSFIYTRSDTFDFVNGVSFFV